MSKDRVICARVYVKEYFKRNPEKKKAHAKLQYAVSKGTIKRGPCQVCGTIEQIQAHHTDYSKPYEVLWLCRQHHRELHGLQKPKTTRIAA